MDVSCLPNFLVTDGVYFRRLCVIIVNARAARPGDRMVSESTQVSVPVRTNTAG